MVNTTYHSEMNDRTAGGAAYGQIKSVQAWKTKKTAILSQNDQMPPAQHQILANLDKAAQGRVGTFDVELENGLAYANTQSDVIGPKSSPSTDSFQFNDVIDIVNPLQHIPIVSMAYRGLTGDTIHPMSQIIGGALYGGPVGAVAGTINAITQMQTGMDIGDHALDLVGLHGRQRHDDSYSAPPEIKLNNVAQKIDNNQPLDNLPGTALAFVNLAEPNRGYQYVAMAEGRTAGKMAVKNANFNTGATSQKQADIKLAMATAEDINLDRLPERDRITSLGLSALPPRKDA